MAVVEITYPFKKDKPDADLLRTQLENLARAINAIGPSQIPVGGLPGNRIANSPNGIGSPQINQFGINLDRLTRNMIVGAMRLGSDKALPMDNDEMKDVPGMILAEWIPDIDCRVHFSGQAYMTFADTSGPTILGVDIRHGASSECFVGGYSTRVVNTSTARTTAHIKGHFDATAGEKYIFKMSVRVYNAGAVNKTLTTIANYTHFSAYALPR